MDPITAGIVGVLIYYGSAVFFPAEKPLPAPKLGAVVVSPMEKTSK